jgi:hypothetical protein
MKKINDPELHRLLLIYKPLLTGKLARGIDLHHVYQPLLPLPLVKLMFCFNSNGKVTTPSVILTVRMQIGYSWPTTGEVLLCRCLISGFYEDLLFVNEIPDALVGVAASIFEGVWFESWPFRVLCYSFS